MLILEGFLVVQARQRPALQCVAVRCEAIIWKRVCSDAFGEGGRDGNGGGQYFIFKTIKINYILRCRYKSHTTMQKKELWAQRYQRRCNIVRREHGKTAVEGRSCKKHRDEEGVGNTPHI